MQTLNFYRLYIYVPNRHQIISTKNQQHFETVNYRHALLLISSKEETARINPKGTYALNGDMRIADMNTRSYFVRNNISFRPRENADTNSVQLCPDCDSKLSNMLMLRIYHRGLKLCIDTDFSEGINHCQIRRTMSMQIFKSRQICMEV